MAICRQGEKHKKRPDAQWQKERFFSLDPKRDKVGFISTEEVTMLLGRKQALRKRPTLLRAEVAFLISSFLKFMKFVVLVLSSLGSFEQTSGSDFSKNFFCFVPVTVVRGTRQDHGKGTESPVRRGKHLCAGRLLLHGQLTKAYLLQLLHSSDHDSMHRLHL